MSTFVFVPSPRVPAAELAAVRAALPSTATIRVLTDYAPSATVWAHKTDGVDPIATVWPREDNDVVSARVAAATRNEQLFRDAPAVLIFGAINTRSAAEATARALDTNLRVFQMRDGKATPVTRDTVQCAGGYTLPHPAAVKAPLDLSAMLPGGTKTNKTAK